MPALDIKIINKLGLHARAASKLVTLTSKFASQIDISKESTDADGKSSIKVVDAKSIMSVMMLAASKGTQLTFETQGADQDQALDAIKLLIENRFDEEE